jgi:hypothetical protein
MNTDKHGGQNIKSEIRNPKSETNRNNEMRKVLKLEPRRFEYFHLLSFEFVLAALCACRSGSDFEIRISDFSIRVYLCLSVVSEVQLPDLG